MNTKQIEMQSVTIFHALNLLVSLRNDVMEIVKDPAVDKLIQADTTTISEEFDSLESALVSAKNFVEAVNRTVLEEEYFSQFEVIDGLSQHPSGLPFEEWSKVNDYLIHFGQPTASK